MCYIVVGPPPGPPGPPGSGPPGPPGSGPPGPPKPPGPPGSGPPGPPGSGPPGPPKPPGLYYFQLLYRRISHLSHHLIIFLCQLVHYLSHFRCFALRHLNESVSPTFYLYDQSLCARNVSGKIAAQSPNLFLLVGLRAPLLLICFLPHLLTAPLSQKIARHTQINYTQNTDIFCVIFSVCHELRFNSII